MIKSRIGVIHPYWNFWESSVPYDLRADRAALLRRCTAVLSEVAEVAVAVTLEDVTEVSGVAAACRRADLRAVVVVSSMAAPPLPVVTLLEALPELPVLIWAVQEEPTLSDSFSHTDVTTRGATVGAPMVAGTLTRSGRPFDLVMASLDGTAVVEAGLTRAVAAGLVRAATILRVGTTVPGYACVDADDEVLGGLGLSVVRVTAAELAERIEASSDGEVRNAEAEVRREFDVSEDVDPRALARALRATVALRRLSEEVGASAGTLNCHVAELRYSPRVGVAPCLALGASTSAGIPWTCTGDVTTAVAMLVVKALGAPALYHEVEAVDYATDEVIIANSGEFDLGLVGPERAALVPNVWFAGDELTGPCARYTIPAGPAALVGFTQLDDGRHRLVVADGAFTGREAAATGTAHAGFRFASGAVQEAWPRWGRSGVSHHSAATNRHLASDVQIVARHLAIECVAV